MTSRSTRFGAPFRAAAALAMGIAGVATGPAEAAPTTLPALFPEPVSITLKAGEVRLGTSVVLLAAPGTDAGTVALVRDVLAAAGVERIATAQQLPAVIDRTHIVLGSAEAAVVRDALKRSKALPDGHKEGYTLTSIAAAGEDGLITLAGQDRDGLFHAVQTFRQLTERSIFPTLVIQDHPAMPIRGTIEGFYGKPWTMADRAKHLEFLGRTKANTYIYSPKDDPYARDRWREAYPAETLSALGALAATARRNHVDFVYAISPGPSICFSDAADRQALNRKFQALRALGVRSFYVALDDIEYTKWNCAGDEAAFGPSGAQAAGIAQADLLNGVQAELVRHDSTAALIMVPTEYYDAKESPYKAALRTRLDPRIIVQWTGTDVVPPAISIPDARAATKAFGRKTLLWDNYPVNDYGQSTGRLLLAPYAKREAGLSGELAGIVSNPMNQEVPSRVAVMGLTSFAWNDRGYDAERTWHAAARELAAGDARVADALLTFFDTQHLAPTFGSQPWQEQAPRLKAMLDGVREAIAGGDAAARAEAIAALARSADAFAAAPDIIRAGVADPGFAEQARPWLQAMQGWGRALQLTAAGLNAANAGSGAAPRLFAEAQRLAAEATAIQSIPGATRFDGPVKIADGVLDRFVADAPRLNATDASRADVAPAR